MADGDCVKVWFNQEQFFHNLGVDGSLIRSRLKVAYARPRILQGYRGWHIKYNEQHFDIKISTKPTFAIAGYKAAVVGTLDAAYTPATHRRQ